MIPAAEVDPDGHVLGPLGDGGVDERGILPREDVGVAVPLLGLGAHLGVAEVGEVRVVELHEAAPGGVEVGELLLEDAREVVEEGLQRGIGRLVDGVAAVAEVDHCGRGDADLGRRGGGDEVRLKKAEVVDLDGRRVPDLVDDDEARGHGAADADVGGLHGAALLDAREVLQEVHVEPPSPELAVRHGAEADGLLLLHHVRDVLVFQLPQLRRRDLARFCLVASGQEGGGPQEGADLVGAVDAGGERHGQRKSWRKRGSGGKR